MKLPGLLEHCFGDLVETKFFRRNGDRGKIDVILIRWLLLFLKRFLKLVARPYAHGREVQRRWARRRAIGWNKKIPTPVQPLLLKPTDGDGLIPAALQVVIAKAPPCESSTEG